jgi:hypothetical protein
MRVLRTLLLVALAAGTLAVAAAPASADDRDLGTEGALLAPPVSAVVRTLAPTAGCHTLLDTGEGDCAVVRTENGDLVVTVEPGPRLDDVLVTRPWVVRVYRPAADVPDGWEVALETQPTTGDATPSIGPEFAAVTAKAVDVTRDGEDELVIGYRSEGTGQILDVDIVGTDDAGTPHVLAHDEIYKGNVVFRKGRLVVYEPVYRQHDANCCPTWIERLVLRARDGDLELDAVSKVKTEDAEIPASQLG